MAGAPKLAIRKITDVTVVSLQEARLLEAHPLDAIGTELYHLVDKMDCRKLVLDLSKVQFLASAAISVLIILHRKSTAIQGSLVICGLRPDLMKIFEIMKLTKVFKFAPDESEALSMFGDTAAS
jgi:anti-anti-sigma factor